MEKNKEQRLGKIITNIPEGIKEMKRYQAGKSIEEVKNDYGLDKIVKLASNENPYGPAAGVIETIQKEAADVFLYPDAESRKLKKALAEKYGLSLERIFLGNGSDEILDLLMTLILADQAEVIQADPSFIKYELAVKSRGGKSVKIPLDSDYRHDLAAMQRAVNQKTRALIICNPNNPTGTTVTKAEIKKLLAEVDDDLLVIVDQAYQEYITEADYFDGVELLAEHPNLMLLRTFSKAYALAGMRIGYALGSPKIFSYLNRIRGPFNVNRLAQKAALTALKAEEHLKSCQQKNKNGKEFLYQEFEKMGLEYLKTESNFLLVDTGLDAVKVFKKLQQEGVIIRPGNQFGMASWIRVTIGTQQQNQFFIQKLKKLLNEESKKERND